MRTNSFKFGNRSISVFLYHDVNDSPSEFGAEFNLTVSNKLFRKQLSWIESNYSIISPSDLLDDKNLPPNPALITFDDGFEGAFENGIKYLNQKGLPALVFLNMGNILNNTPLISSIAAFLEKKGNTYKELFQNIFLQKPFHLNLTPEILVEIQQSIYDFNMDEIQKYQGSIATVEILKKWENCKNVFYGNHLYEHWNSSSLDSDEFEFQFTENRRKLSLFKNSIDFFSFPNGQPDLCFSNVHIKALRDFGCKKIFFSSGGTNLMNAEFIFNRIDMTNYEYNTFKMFYRVAMTRVNHTLPRKASILIRRFL